MILKKYLLGSFAALCAIFFIGAKTVAQHKKTDYTKYYVSNSGNDNNTGTIDAPFQTIQKINSLNLKPHSIVYFKAGETFKGKLIIRMDQAEARDQWIAFSSYGGGKATLNADSGRAISIYKSANVVVRNLKLTGLGRKTGNRENGLAIINSENIKVDNMDISGFQKSGLLIDSSSSVYCDGVFVHDNGSAGITVEGRNSKKDSRNIKIFDCRAQNNPGDPTKLDNHSGNGIVVGHCTNVTIEACTATNNGWDMPRIGNGPVGIWCYEADSVTIRYCLSYYNKTSKGGADGGGFDFDGGTTNSIIENCFSYGNQGSGFCIFQYWGASTWHDNIVRNNISENDGTVSDSQAGLYIWNSSDDPKQFYNCKVYGNIVYNTKVAAISFSDKSENGGSVILGSSLLTSNNIPVAGEYEIKNAQAMKIMDSFGAGGSFTEYYAMDFTDDVVLMGHDGPCHPAIAEGRIKVKPLAVYHGKVGSGLSVEMSVKHGPVTLLSVVETGDGKLFFLVAEAASVAGPVLEIGNTNSRYRFAIGAKDFVEQWNAHGPAHHCAIGVGHIAAKIMKLGQLLGIETVKVC